MIGDSTVQFQSICYPCVTVACLTKFSFCHLGSRGATSAKFRQFGPNGSQNYLIWVVVTNNPFVSYYHGTTFWKILSISFVLTQFLTCLPPECSGLFPKHLIHSLIILLHRNLWIGCYASIEQVLGPPFDKMSHTVTARQVCQTQSPTTKIESINEACQSEFELFWQMSCQVTLLPVLTQTHP